MAMISNLPVSDFHVGLQLFEERSADFLPSLGLSLQVFDAFAPLKPISQPTLTSGVSIGKPQQAKQTALTSYGAFLIQLPDISEDSSTAPPTVRARPAALPSIPGDMAAPQNVPTKAKGAPPAQESKPASRRPLPQPRDAQKGPANIPRVDAPAGRTGTHAAPAPPRVQTPQIAVPQAKNAPHGRVPQGRPGTPHAQVPAPHGYKHGDKPRAPATPHAKVPYAPGPYYSAKAQTPLKAHYGVCV